MFRNRRMVICRYIFLWWRLYIISDETGRGVAEICDIRFIYIYIYIGYVTDACRSRDRYM